MNVHSEEVRQRLSFIDRTIVHAARACRRDGCVSQELRNYVDQMGRQAIRAQRALQARDEHRVRESVEDLARLSDRAQNVIHPADGMTYELKSAVILTHIELLALRCQLD
jgi:hypothetical protein